ncbi:MAG: ATP-binding protein [Candidatus Marinimicrobia bacterium]|nr:ATP-binding protein [Candidatus Neomarinimicrobiota bacterium]
MIKPNPFTPKSGLEPKVFVNRKKEIDLFNQRIKNGKEGNINHYIINGQWGSGKTSLLRYFRLIAQEKDCYASYFLAREIAENTPDIEICAHLIQSILRNIPSKVIKKDSNINKTISGFGIQIMGSGFNMSFDINKGNMIDPQIFLADSLLNIWKDISKDTELLVVLVDDVQNFSKVQRIFTILKNVLSEQKIIQQTKILFILSSTIEGWKPFIKRNHPIGRFFIPRIELDNFHKKETIELIDKILKKSGVTFTDFVKENIYKYTKGHLFQIHALGNALYDNHKKGKVTKSEWENGFEEGLSYLGNAVYDGIVKGISDNEIKIIKNINPTEGNKINDIKSKVDIDGLNVYLRRLVDKGILNAQKRGEYIISDKMLWEYIQAK